MSWFTKFSGLSHEDPARVRDMFRVQGSRLISAANGRVAEIGQFANPTLAQLRALDGVTSTNAGDRVLCLSEYVGDVQALHLDPANAGALFQVASQFNLLEMVGPDVSPDEGVGLYDHDKTQGPACAIACGAGTIYRNYFVPIDGAVGQTRDRQINCLSDLEQALGNATHRYWHMQNGYALLTAAGLQDLPDRLDALCEPDRDALRGLVRVGLHRGAEVTLNQQAGHLVTQVYCSAMPVAYGQGAAQQWAAIAQLVLDAAYEATLRVAVDNARKTGNRTVYLTMLGGGAFGNEPDWIAAALLRALTIVQSSALDVRLVSFGHSSAHVANILDCWAQP